MNSKQEKKRRLLKIISVIAMILCMIAFFVIGKSLSYQKLADWIPHRRVLAALLVTFLYAAKSLTVFFPLVTLYLLAGLLFPTPMAVLINLLGLVVCDTVPYLIGKLLGPEELDRLREKYSKLHTVETLRQKSAFQFAVLTRSIGILPGDIVSLYFGCTGLRYPAYLMGSILGLAPGMIAATILGSQISNPGSPGFLVAAGCGIVMAIISFIACNRAIKKDPEKKKTDKKEGRL